MNIADISLSNKYTNWYINLMNNAKTRASSRKEAKRILGAVEGHHILPKSIYKNKEIVYLSIREHFLAHWLLTKMLTGSNLKKMEHAMTMMKNNRQLTFSQIKICKSFSHSPCTDTRRKNISDARKNTRRITCEHCNKDSDPGNYKQYHGEKCKLNPDVDITYWKYLSDKNKRSMKIAKENGTHVQAKPKTGEFTCPHCSSKGTNYGSMMKNHFNRCKQNTNQIHPDVYQRKTCENCLRSVCRKIYRERHGERCSSLRCD